MPEPEPEPEPEPPAVSQVGTTAPGASSVVGQTMPVAADPMTTASLAADPATTPTGTSSTLADQFVAIAQAQKGDTYVFGAEASLDDADPDSFDCSELTQWAAHQVGVTIPDGAMYQYLEMKNEGQLMSVDEALQTKGALLFYFSSEPTPSGGRPSSAHVAISLGDGRTIEAKGTGYGVNEFPAEGRFNYAGVIPEMGGAATSGLTTLATSMPAPADTDSDQDGLSDAFEQMVGLDPLASDSDGDGIDDATEQLGIASAVAAPEPLSKEQVSAALSQQGLEARADEDADGLSNQYEVKHGLDATLADTDEDGLADSTEVVLGTSGTHLDSDADGLSDFLEQELGSDPLTSGTPVDQWGLGSEEAPDQTSADELAQTMDVDSDLG
jgi:cell wall-associated NlpC family hydrolase